MRKAWARCWKSWRNKNWDEQYEEWVRSLGDFGNYGWMSGICLVGGAVLLMILKVRPNEYYQLLPLVILFTGVTRFLEYLGYAERGFLGRFWRSLRRFERVGIWVMMGVWVVFILTVPHFGVEHSFKKIFFSFLFYILPGWFLILDTYAWWRRKVLGEAAVEAPHQNVAQDAASGSNPV